jgi:hypothetical protein
MNQLKQSTQLTVNIVAKLLPFVIQIALIALTIFWLNQSSASASIEVPNGDYSDPCADLPYANIVEPADAADPCAEASDDYLKFVEPSDNYDECEEAPQLVSFEIPDAEAEPCAEAAEQFAKFAEPGYSLDECVEYPTGLSLIHFEFPNDLGDDCQTASTSTGQSA